MRRKTTAILCLACVLAVLGNVHAEDKKPPRSFKNTAALLGQDLGETREYEVPGRRDPFTGREIKGRKSTRLTLSLAEGEHWQSGKAWLIHEESDAGTQTYEAWKGTYQLFTTADTDVMALYVGMTRRYTGTRGPDGIDWVLDGRYEPKQVRLEMAIEDDTFPDQPVLTATDGSFIDASGKTVVKRDEPYTLKEKLLRTGEIRTARPDFIPIGRTLKLVPRDARQESFAASPPPAFRLRKSAGE